MYEFWYNYIKPKYKCNAKLCYMDTHGVIIHIKTENVYEDIANDVEKSLDISSYAIECNFIERPLPTGKNKKVVGLMREKVGGQIITEFFGLRQRLFNR